MLNSVMASSLKSLKGRVVVVGAGMQDYSHLIPHSAEIIATDINKTSSVTALADAHNLPFQDESFDSYLAIEVLEHLQSPERAVREIQRVLTINGVAVLSIPFLFRVHGDPNDFQRFTRSGLQILFAEFREVKITEYGNRLHVISDLVTTASKFMIPLRLLNHFFRLPWCSRASFDAPSGYIVTVRK